MSAVTEAELNANKNKIIELVNNYNDSSNGYPTKLAKEIVKIQEDIKNMGIFWTTDSGKEAINNLSSIATDLAKKLRDLNALVSFSSDDISWQRIRSIATTRSLTEKN